MSATKRMIESRFEEYDEPRVTDHRCRMGDQTMIELVTAIAARWSVTFNDAIGIAILDAVDDALDREAGIEVSQC